MQEIAFWSLVLLPGLKDPRTPIRGDVDVGAVTREAGAPEMAISSAGRSVGRGEPSVP